MSAPPLQNVTGADQTTMYDQKRPDVAVFIDFENIYVSVRDKLNATPNFEAIMDRCNDLGRVVISRAYADWYRYPRITSALYANAIEPIYVATYYYDKDAGRTGRAIKNSVDMNLCIDAMKTLYTNPNISRFVLVTGDRDFIPLVHSIRQHGKEVYIIGIGGAASTHLAQSADEFVFYEQLIGRQPNASAAATAIANRATELNRLPEPIEEPIAPVAPPPPPPPEPDIYDVLVQAIHLARKRGYVTTLGSLKMLMKELMGGDFKESRYRDLNGRPFTKFKDLVLDAEQRGKVQIFTKGSVNEVFLPGEDPMKLSRFAPLLTEEPPPEPLVLDPPIGSNGAVQLAEIEPVIIEEVKTTVAEIPAATPSSSNRRRRRRSRRNNRNREEVTANGLGTEPAITDDQEDRAIDELDYTPPQLEEPPVATVAIASSDEGAVIETVVPSEHLPPSLADAAEPVAVVVESEPTPKTGRSRRRRSRKATAESTPTGESSLPETTVAEPSVAEPVVAATPPAEPVVAATPPAEPTPSTTTNGSSDHVDLTLEFSTEEWQLFRTTIRELGKPATFQQLLSALQTARRKHGLPRTMEENRTMLKQAIHHGLLERTTRNRYVYYTLKELE